jgi:hypothetical protein
MRITSVKLLNDGASIDWTTGGNGTGNVVRHSTKNGTEPAPSFRAAVDELKPDVCELMEVPEKWMETVTVKGITAGYDDDGTIEASVAFVKRYKSGKVTGHSTIRVRQRSDHTEQGSAFMGEELEARIKNVIREAEKYVSGLRAQTEH